jgi:CNT family concentrative nucleoside transporter
VPAEDCLQAGQLLGVKTVANEFIAYQQMGEMIKGETPQIGARSQSIMTYALSGFSNFAAIGIQIGGIGGLVPERRADLARFGLRAMIGGMLACCMTACIAGVLL